MDGMVTNQADLTDELYAQAALHDESGAWQMIFGVNTLPAYRRQGIAETLLRRAIAGRPGAGPPGAGADLQGAPAALLRQAGLCE